jgi:hypothetical protein
MKKIKKIILHPGFHRFIIPIVGGLVILNYSYFKTDRIPKDDFQEMFNRNYAIFALKIPEKLDFAGENVPLEYFDVKESFDRELLVNTYWQSQTLLFIKRANRYFPMIEQILRENGVPDDFKYLALAESGLTQAVSPKNAVGFWQFMKSTAREYGLEVSEEVDERYNIEKSTVAACKYLKKAYEKFNSWTMVAASYNNGRTGLIKQINRQDEDYYYDLLLNDETGRYLYRILSLKIILSDPEKYGFYFRSEDLYPPIRTKKVEVDSAVHSMVDFARHFNLNYKTLKYFNPWLRDNRLTNHKNKIYFIEIPVDLDFRYGSYFPKYLESKN